MEAFYEVYDTASEVKAYANYDGAARKYNVVALGNGENPQDAIDLCPSSCACPKCGERNIDFLALDDDEIVGEVDLNTAEMIAVFEGLRDQAVRTFTVAVFDTQHANLICNDKMDFINNPFVEGMDEPTAVTPIGGVQDEEFNISVSGSGTSRTVSIYTAKTGFYLYRIWLIDDAAAPQTATLTAPTGGNVTEWWKVTDADGTLTLTITETGSNDWYVAAALVARVQVSSALFAPQIA
jgi:hypothetical protein